MKKLLGLLAATSLVASSSAAVISCGKETPQVGDDKEEQALLKTQFVSEVKQTIQNFIQSRTRSLFQTIEKSDTNTFLNQTTLAQIYGDSTSDVTHTLTAQQKGNLVSDINKILEIESELKQIIETQMREQTKYAFLLEGIDSIYKSIVFNDTVIINKQVDGEDYVYNLTFNITVEFNYKYNSVVESDSFTPNKQLIFSIASNGQIVVIVNKIASDLGQWMYNKYYNSFTFDDQKLGITKEIFAKQSSKVQSTLQKNTLVTNIEAIFADEAEINLDITKIDFELSNSDAYKRMYGQNVRIPVADNGFIENAMFFKNDDVSDENLQAQFDADNSTTLNYEKFMTDSKNDIKENLNIAIDLATNSAKYSEYGYVSLDDFTITVGQMELNLNSINLLYVYNPTKSFAIEVANTFKAWKTSWNIKKSEDRYALFKMDKEGSTMAQEVWAGIASNSNSFLDSVVNKNKAKFYGASIQDTAFNSFFISHSNSGRVPYSVVDDNGFAINYSGFWDPQNWSTKGWKMYVTFDNLRFELGFSDNQNYIDNLWYGRYKSKYVIEK